MTTYTMLNYISDPRSLTDAEQAGAMFDFTAREVMWTGHSGQSLWIGPEDAEQDLRVDIDVDAGRAALTWLSDETIGIELEPGPALTVVWSGDAPPVTVPGILVRVSAATARRAVLEYIETGERPTCARWAAEPAVAARPRAMFRQSD